MTAFPRKYVALIEESFERQVDIRTLERQFFEIDHCTAGATMMLRWQLPETLMNVCLRHHDPAPAQERGLLANIMAANRTAHLAGFQPVFELEVAETASAPLAEAQAAALSAANELHARINAYCQSL